MAVATRHGGAQPVQSPAPRKGVSMLLRHRDQDPAVDPSAFVAPTATLVGDVRVGPRARVLYGAVLDAEASRIQVGECAIVCEHAVLRATAAGGVARSAGLADHVFIG